MAAVSSSRHSSMKRQWSDGLGSIIPELTADNLHTESIFSLVLIVNTPQLVLSLVYLFYNNLFTCMLVSAEWISFAHQRKSLRVTRPKGQQRSTYFLSLPYRFSLPLLVASMLLHWMISQSLFLVQVDVHVGDGDGPRSPRTLGWSSLALMILLIVGGLLIVGLVAFGFKRYKPGMPLVLSDWRAISAACHTWHSSDPNQSLGELQYGVNGHAKDSKYHVGFSSGPVRPLVDGETWIWAFRIVKYFYLAKLREDRYTENTYPLLSLVRA